MLLKNNRKGGVPYTVIWFVVILVLVLVVIKIISDQTQTGTDAFGYILCLHKPDFDPDHDGLGMRNDSCPCNSDNFFDVRTYFIDGTNCAVKMRCHADSGDTVYEKFVDCPTEDTDKLTKETSKITYFFSTKDKACKSWGKKEIQEKYSECKQVTETNDEVTFDHECADKILAKHTVTKSFTYDCKTSQGECKGDLKKLGC